MVFSSLLFLFAFLTPQLIIYFLIKDTRARNVILLVFSLFFYAWGGPKYVILLVSEAFFSWYIALQISKCSFKKTKRLWMVMECILLLGLLAFFKYTGFFLSNLKFIFGWPEIVPKIVLPIGISFYTFQLISYVADVYKGDVEAQPNYFKILLYASLFHQCIAGPIVRYKTVAAEIDERYVSLKDFSEGIRRFSVGLAKKAILANGCAAIADQMLPEGLSKLAAAPSWNIYIGVFCYMLQIYLDFSAYSDMAIGMGRMVGFHYLENFNYPYTAGSVQDFWRRWHISLSTFFRDYVYIPLGGNRKGEFRTYVNLFIVWFLTGMWHGASWNFIFWGLYYFIFLAMERLFLGKALKKSWGIIGHIYTLIVVFFGWAIFKFTDFASLKEVFRGLFFIGHPVSGPDTLSVLKQNVFFLIIAIIAVFPIGKSLHSAVRKSGKQSGNRLLLGGLYFTDMITPVILLILSVLALVGNSYNPFLYFQF